MAQTLFSSTDTSAPVLDGNVGSLVNVLDACLVNGYGVKASLGWAKAFSGTNKAAYRAPEGTRFYLRVQDDGPNTAVVGRESRLNPCESLSDIDTMVDPFPTSEQAAFGILAKKSRTADATAVPWALIGDSKRFIFMIYGGLVTNAWSWFYFGDLIPAKTTDSYHSIIIGHNIIENNGLNYENYVSSSNSGGLTAHYICRGIDDITKSIKFANGSNPFIASSTSYLGRTTTATYPESASQKLHIHPLYVGHEAGSSRCIRGTIAGIYDVLHNNPLTDQDTFSIGGENFKIFKHANVGCFALKTSAWE